MHLPNRQQPHNTGSEIQSCSCYFRTQFKSICESFSPSLRRTALMRNGRCWKHPISYPAEILRRLEIRTTRRLCYTGRQHTNECCQGPAGSASSTKHGSTASERRTFTKSIIAYRLCFEHSSLHDPHILHVQLAFNHAACIAGGGIYNWIENLVFHAPSTFYLFISATILGPHPRGPTEPIESEANIPISLGILYHPRPLTQVAAVDKANIHKYSRSPDPTHWISGKSYPLHGH